MKRFYRILPCFLLLFSLLLCACTDAVFLTEDTFLARFNALDETQQLNATDALAREEGDFIGRSYFLAPKGEETYLLTLQIDPETAELKSCALLYARLEDEESASHFTSLVSRTVQAFTGHSAQECEQALKEAGILGAAHAEEANARALEWNGFRIKKERISLGQKMTIETVQQAQATQSSGEAQASAPTTKSDTAAPETGAPETMQESGTS